MRRDALAVLFARGWATALGTWKGLLVALVLNAALALALAQPVASALHATLDRSTYGERLLKGDVTTFFEHFQRNDGSALGPTGGWDALLTGGEPKKQRLASAPGAAGAAVWAGLAMALLSAILAGGFAGRFGAESERGSLAAFGADVGRYGPSSLFLGLLSFAGIVGAYLGVYAASGKLYETSDLRYEWEAVGLSLLRLFAFLLMAGCVRLLVLYARAAMGLRGSANPFLALARSAGFLLSRPARALALEVLFGVTALLPLLAWLAWGPAWDGKDAAGLALLVIGQQLVLLFRIASRYAHLGAAVAFLRRASEAPAKAAAPAAEPGVLLEG